MKQGEKEKNITKEVLPPPKRKNEMLLLPEREDLNQTKTALKMNKLPAKSKVRTLTVGLWLHLLIRPDSLCAPASGIRHFQLQF